MGCNSHISLTVRGLQVGTYALFAAEVYAWFCVGEIVGEYHTVLDGFHEHHASHAPQRS